MPAGPALPERPADTRDSSPAAGPIPDHLRIEPWHDPVVDTHGYDPRSPYVERFWIGVLGPSAVWLHRLVSSELAAAPLGTDVDLRVVAGQLGLRWNGGRHSPMYRTIERCCSFRTARWLGEGCVGFRLRLPPLTKGQLRRLPPELDQEHARWTDARILRRRTAAPDLHAETLATAFVERGATLHEAVGWLDTCGVPVETAREATVRAWSGQDGHPTPEITA